jgi:mono/diheme cytochrome c family protein
MLRLSRHERRQINGVDLRAGKFLTVRTDEDLARVLASGRPAAGMPSFAVLHTDEARAIIAYIRSNFDATAEGVKIGDAARGAAIFDGKGGCTRAIASTAAARIRRRT